MLEFARWSWTNRHDAVQYELAVIREGQEADDYLRIMFRAQHEFVKCVCPPSSEPRVTPCDLDAAWRELQKREGNEP